MDEVRIVIADDDADLLRLLGQRLSKAGYTVMPCSNGDDAYDLVVRRRPVILLADWNMPGLAGPDLCRRIRASTPDSAVYIILLTVNDDPAQIIAGLEAGADDYLIKPAHDAELVARIQSGERVLRLLAQQEERASELEAVIENNPTGIIIVDAQTQRVVRINSSARRLAGLTEEKVIGRPHWDFICPLENDASPSPDRGRPIDTSEWILLGTGGRRIPVLRSAVAITVDGREHLLEAIIDISDRKQAEEELQRSYARTEQLLTSISSILIGVDENDRITQWNEWAEVTFGISAADALGRAFRGCGIRWDWSIIAQHVEKCRAENRPVRPNEVRFQRPDGTDGFLGMRVNPVRWETDKSLGFLVVAADITERKILEGQLAQAQKLESIGQLAAGIAHEINTPTQFVGDNTRFLQDAFGDLQGLLDKYAQLAEASRTGSVALEVLAQVDAAVKEADLDYLKEQIPQAIAQALEGIERVTRIVRAMKDFSHPGGEGVEAVDLNKAIESTITVARNEWKYVAEMVADFDPSLPLVPCFLGDFNQVILNIIINATHAIAGVVGDGATGKGTITVSTRHDDDWAEIRIRDTGTGIPSEHRSKVFDHFFTTKEVGKGTGQGLSIAHAVVTEKHGGTITFETEMGKGTTFIIRLPIEHKPATPKETPHHEEAYSLR